MYKTSQLKTQCKGDISHAFETAKITMFDHTCAKQTNKQTFIELWQLLTRLYYTRCALSKRAAVLNVCGTW